MNKNERELFFYLCNFIQCDSGVTETLLSEYATPEVLGNLFFNRMQGVAYGTLKKAGLLGKVNREFRNSLAAAYQQNIEKNTSFFICLEMLSEVLKPAKNRYAMLKGALLCAEYPDGYRTSNDIDLLVREKDVTFIGDILNEAGFKQGNIRNGEFTPATRREIVESKMMRGETVPYILEVDLPHMKFLEVDINFSLDYKNGDGILVDAMLSRTSVYSVRDATVMSLDKYDFFIHLCCHLYKEATTYPWVKMKRDMTLYKFTDILMLLDKLDVGETENLFKRANEMELADICACVIGWTVQMFEVSYSLMEEYVKKQLDTKEELFQTVVWPSEHKTFVYREPNIKNRFCADDRIKLLEEI